MAPPEFRIAVGAFSAAAVIFLARVGWWLCGARSSMWERSVLTLAIFGITGIAWVESVRWVNNRRTLSTEPLAIYQDERVTSPTIRRASPGVAEFMITVLGGNVFVPGKDPTLTGLALRVRIRNAGSPSIATDWVMFLTVPGEAAPVRAQLTTPPKRLTLNGPAGRTVLRATDFSLEEQTANKALEPGDPPVEGWMLFHVRLPQAKVLDPSTVIEMRASDFSGRVFFGRQKQGEWLSR